MDTSITKTVDLHKAKQIILHSIRPVGSENLHIINAFGRTLIENIVSRIKVPMYDTSLIDGYAIESRHTTFADSTNPCKFSILTECINPYEKQLEINTAIRVKSGDGLPHGADAVVDLKQSYRPQNGPELFVMSQIKHGENISMAGKYIDESETLLTSGIIIGSKEMALLATAGVDNVKVSRKPVVSIVTTGREFIDMPDKLKPGQMRNSSKYDLVGMLLEAGCEIGQTMHIKGGRNDLETAILVNSTISDLIIVSLSSADSYDLTLSTIQTSGKLLVSRVFMQPAAASGFAYVDMKPTFILPANNVTESFEALVRPAILSMTRSNRIERKMLKAVLQTTIKPERAYCYYIKAFTTYADGELMTKPLGFVSVTSELRPWTPPNSIIVIPQDSDMLKKGDYVDILMLD